MVILYSPQPNGSVRITQTGKGGRVLGHVTLEGKFVARKGVRLTRKERESREFGWKHAYGKKWVKMYAKGETYIQTVAKSVAWLEALFALDDPRGRG